MKKKILIVTSNGGGGQTSIAHALEESLATTYTVVSRSAFTDILYQIDPIQVFTFGKYIAEDMYNTVSTYKSLWKIHKGLYRLGTWYYRIFFRLIERRFTEFLFSEQIDGVISIIPIMNRPILSACEAKGIPFLIYSPDINPEMYLEYLKNIQPKVPCALAVPTHHPHIDALARKKHLPLGFVHEVGFPLRGQFFSQIDRTQLKQQYKIPLDRPVILTLLGSLGSPNLATIATYMAKLKHPAHLILCTGRYEAVKKALSKIPFPSHISHTIVGYTKQMNDYMRMSDIFFTKSGSVSVGEALYLNIPLLLDGTASILPWEQFNHHFVEEKGFGKSIKSYDDIHFVIDGLLAHEGKKLEKMKNALKAFALKDGNHEIKHLLTELFAQTETAHVPALTHHYLPQPLQKKKA